MSVSQAVRDVLLTFVCMAIFTLHALAVWLVDEETIRRYKETHND
jgi:hypothetical protein